MKKKKFACMLMALCLLGTMLVGCVEQEEPPIGGESGVDEFGWPETEDLGDSDFTAEHLVWQDEFNGDTIDTTKWGFDIGNGNNGWGNQEKQYYTEENARVRNGKLQILAKGERYKGFEYTSAKLKTQGKFALTYGRVEAKIKLPLGQGLWPAFWMLPEFGTWPTYGEIDIMEAKGRLPGESSCAIHYGSPGHQYQSGTMYHPAGTTINEWHVYALDWTEDSIKIYVDENLIFKKDKGDWTTGGIFGDDLMAPYNADFYLILNLAVGGHFDGYREPTEEDLPALMEVDYVRVYSKDIFDEE